MQPALRAACYSNRPGINPRQISNVVHNCRKIISFGGRHDCRKAGRISMPADRICERNIPQLRVDTRGSVCFVLAEGKSMNKYYRRISFLWLRRRRDIIRSIEEYSIGRGHGNDILCLAKSRFKEEKTDNKKRSYHSHDNLQ